MPETGGHDPLEAEQKRARRTPGSRGRPAGRDRVRGRHVTASERSCRGGPRCDRVPGRGRPDQAIRFGVSSARREGDDPCGIGRGGRRRLDHADGRAHRVGHPGSSRPRPDRDAPSNVPRLPGPAGHQRGHLGGASDGERDDLPACWLGAGRRRAVRQARCRRAGRPVDRRRTRSSTSTCSRAAGRAASTRTPYPHTAAGLAQALSAFWGQDPNQTPFFSNSSIAPIATKPAPATLGGYPAWHLQILIPSTFDFSACDGGQLVLWETRNESVRSGLGAGEIDRIWVVDVHGALVVVDAALPLLASKTQETELQAVIDSVAFPSACQAGGSYGVVSWK